MDDDKIERVRIKTRGYELSSDGNIGVGQFLRYLEHTRWSTIGRSQKLPMRKFFVLGVVRAQNVEILRQIGFDEEIDISMWVSRVGRTSIEYSHDIVRVRDGELIGRSSATIVALDAERRPAAISEEARAYVLERAGLRAERLDGPVPEGAWEKPIGLRPSDQDLQQHVNHARYAELAEDTRFFCAQTGGYGAGDFTGPPRRFSIAYEHEARVSDSVVGKTWLGPGPERSVDFALVKASGELLVRARIIL